MTTITSQSAAPSTTKNWAVSAIVLGIIVLVMQFVGVASAIVSLRAPVHLDMGAAYSTVNWSLQILGILVSIAFIAGGARTVKGIESGREVLEYTALAAGALTILGACLTFFMVNSQTYQLFMQASMAKAAAANPIVLHILPIIRDTTLGFTAVMTIVQLAYSIGMYRHMSRR